MIPGILLEWALVAVSLFCTILLLWLGMTLWLNADQRSAGVTVTAAGFGLGAAFFVSHSALLLSENVSLAYSNTLWLAVAMIPVVVLPYVWYVVLLWYCGYWTRGDDSLRRRHQNWLWLAGAILVAGLACLVLLGMPFVPMLSALAPILRPAREWIKMPVLGIPLVALGYPLYVLLCVALSLEALRRPGVTGRLLGEAARQKARPWLIAATALLLAVGILVAASVLWTITHTQVQGYYVLTPDKMRVIGRFDLVIAVLIAIVIVLLGQAMTAYELFTGKVLPRRALARQWKRAIWLAAGYGLLMGGALVWGLEPVYAILLTALLMTVFFALLSWRSYADWEQAMHQLRPFVASQRWYDALVASPAGESPPPDPFQALCEELLNTTVAHLIPIGATAALVSPASYPAGSEAGCPSAGSLAQRAFEQARLILAIDPGHYGGAAWAVPLWRERGLVGVLLLGPRRDGSLYTEEEIEIARSTGERLIDLAASLALSQRLMQLQRERMATTQILDQRTRRMLHDEVLPLIHAAMLSLAAGQPVDAVNRQLSDAHGQVSTLLRELPPSLMPELARLGLLGALQKAVRVEFAPAFDQVAWSCDPEAKEQAARLNPVAAETVYYAVREAVRNAARHARPAGSEGPLHLKIRARVLDGQLQIQVEDDGTGLGSASGSGQGLALHSTLMAIVGGSLSLETVPGQMTRVQIAVPLP